MSADVTPLRGEENVIRIRVAMLLAAITAAAMLIIGVLIFGDGQNRVTRTRPTIDQIDPCSPYLLGSQLSPYEEMELEERCAQKERFVLTP